MRGVDQQQSGMFSYILAEQRVPQGHPLRRIDHHQHRPLPLIFPPHPPFLRHFDYSLLRILHE